MDCYWFKSGHCQSCELLEYSYSQTLKIKEHAILKKFEGRQLHLKETVGLKNGAEHSRNKVKLAVYFEDGEYVFGIYDANGKFKKLEECPLHLIGINELLPNLKIKLKQYQIMPYSIESKKGELKYIMISKSQSHEEILIRFVLRSKESLDRLKKMAEVLLRENTQIKVITANIQPEHKAILEGDVEIVLTEVKEIRHQFNDIMLTLGPRSFFQVTPEIAVKLYESAGEIVKEYSANSFLDLFCGVGAFSYFAAKHVPEVLGVELSQEAIESAIKSQKINVVKGELNFLSLDVEDFLKNLAKKKYDVILVNPPRRGLNISILKDILKQEPRLIIYSSCNVETLERDSLSLTNDYEIVSTQIYDMFPFTHHFETLMVFRRKGA